jgi:hypothetical protein
LELLRVRSSNRADLQPRPVPRLGFIAGLEHGNPGGAVSVNRERPADAETARNGRAVGGSPTPFNLKAPDIGVTEPAVDQQHRLAFAVHGVPADSCVRQRKNAHTCRGPNGVVRGSPPQWPARRQSEDPGPLPMKSATYLTASVRFRPNRLLCTAGPCGLPARGLLLAPAAGTLLPTLLINGFQKR